MVIRAMSLDRESIMAVLEHVMDPEVPVLSVVELGIVRDVDVVDGVVQVTVTPTYSGCPAMAMIERDITEALHAHGIEQVDIRTVYSPAWTTDWIPAAACEKLRAYGIAPPGPADHDAPVQIGRKRSTVRCPFCGSSRTTLKSDFGSTACKSIHVCDDCRQPFEEFKAI